MKIKSIIAALVAILITGTAWGSSITLPYTHHLNTVAPWTQVYFGSSLDTSTSAPGSASTSLKFPFSAGHRSGFAPDKVWVDWDNQNELWFQIWVKMSSNWTWNCVGQKVLYFYTTGSDTGTNWYIWFLGPLNSPNPNLSATVQRHDGSAYTYYGSKKAQLNTWHKITIHMVRNTTENPGNGVIQLWLDDQLSVNQSAVTFTKSTNPDLGRGWDGMSLEPVYGGQGCPAVPEAMSMWMDYIQVQTTPFSQGVDQLPPYVDTFSPGDGATGVAQETTSASFHIKDSGDGVDITTLDVGGLGCSSCGSCDSGLTCSGTSSDYTITRTGLSLSYEQVWSENINADDLASTPNTMTQFTYNFTVEPDPAPPALDITTTSIPSGVQGVAYSTSLAATGGTTPYSWSVVSGSLPTGTSLSGGGVLSGTPIESGTFNFTAQVEDFNTTTDNQALTLVVSPPTPGGQDTIDLTSIIDTYVNGGSPDSNYSSSTEFRTYQWPYAQVANRGLMRVDISSIPDNVSVSSATLYLYLTGYDWDGGTNPMTVYVYRITGSVPDITTVTWDNFAGTLSAAESSAGVTLSTGFFPFDVTNMVQNAYGEDATYLYIAVDGGTQGNADTNRYFASMDHGTSAWRPYITVTYTSGTGGSNPPPSAHAPGKLRINSGGSFKTWH